MGSDHLKRKQESIVVLVIALLIILMAGIIVFLTGASTNDRSITGSDPSVKYYSQPITILTQTAPDSGGRAAYVKMTFVLSFNQRRHLQASEANDAQIRSLISSEMNRYSPDALLEPLMLDQMQASIQSILTEDMGLESNGVFLDRITVQ
ncbi:hypothetical protein [Anoxynatronum buryatiense]|uniref:Flagellar basal body-associated protein FliL n=1 Tax=Anoxynatronum buryatiense TaxID=489973 RepID=A0AA46AHB3_9CLOT|nr:hypothetical protein [Anoxynatronum buryatiense]SMP37928.1 Flagellar basal body-associated protein FliL [Anoxynatronum buryatiense]